MTKIVELIISEDNLENEDGVFAISLVEEPAIEEHWIALNKQKKDEKVITFAKLDEDKRLLIAPALIPNKQIIRVSPDGEDYYVYFSRKTINRASQLFLQNHHQSEATYQHEHKVNDITVVESWIKEFTIDKSVNYGFEHLPVGTWFVTMKVDNDEVWEKVKNGDVKGFSIEGYFTDKMQEMSKTEEDVILERIKEIILSDSENK